MITSLHLEAVQALLNRAKAGLLATAFLQCGPKHQFEWWQGYAKALHDMTSDAGQKLADKDLRLGGYQLPSVLQIAADVLNEDVYRLSRAEIEDRITQAGIKVPIDSLALSDFAGPEQLKNGTVTTIDLNDEHRAARVNLNDGSCLHSSPQGNAVIVAQGGAA